MNALKDVFDTFLISFDLSRQVGFLLIAWLSMSLSTRVAMATNITSQMKLQYFDKRTFLSCHVAHHSYSTPVSKISQHRLIEILFVIVTNRRPVIKSFCHLVFKVQAEVSSGRVC